MSNSPCRIDADRATGQGAGIWDCDKVDGLQLASRERLPRT